jgi:hypothetical protein
MLGRKTTRTTRKLPELPLEAERKTKERRKEKDSS